jgi:hypothetical protein
MRTARSNMPATAPPQTKLTVATEWSIVALTANLTGFLALLSIKYLVQLFQLNIVTSQQRVSLDMVRPKLLDIPLIALIAGLLCGWAIYRVIHHGLPQRYSLVKLGVAGISSATLLLGLPFWLFFIFLTPPYPEMHVATDIAGYRIEEVHYWTTYEESWLDLVVTRQDGKQYRATIGFSGLEVCSRLSTTRIATKIYFRCNDAAISSQTPYVDKCLANRVSY